MNSKVKYLKTFQDVLEYVINVISSLTTAEQLYIVLKESILKEKNFLSILLTDIIVTAIDLEM